MYNIKQDIDHCTQMLIVYAINEVFGSLSYSKVDFPNQILSFDTKSKSLRSDRVNNFLKLKLYRVIMINGLFYERNCSVNLWFLCILKGSAIIGMLEAVMGQDKFFEGVGVRF